MNYQAGFIFSNIMLLSFDPKITEKAKEISDRFESGDSTDDINLWEEWYIHLEGIDWYLRLPDEHVMKVNEMIYE